MAITAADVKKLRDMTGAGMMDAKKALVEADGDYDKATELLRISGATKVATRSDREASNGMVAASGKSMIQLGAETDFVAKNEEFVALASQIVEAVDAAAISSVEAAGQVALANGQTVADAIAGLAGKIGEKIELVQIVCYDGNTHTYLHRRSQDLPPQVGVLVEYTGADNEELIHNVALQIASMKARYVKSSDIEPEIVEGEKRIAEATAREEGKPDHIIAHIVEGRIKAFYNDVCLNDQVSIINDKITVGKMLEDAGVIVTRFSRFATAA